MDRRKFMTTTAALGTVLALSPARADAADVAPMSEIDLETAMFNPTGRSLPAGELRSALATVQNYYRDAKYAQIGRVLPKLMDRARGLNDPVILTQVYVLASEHLLKVGDDDLAYITAERARAEAERSGDAVSEANAAWIMCVMMRHSNRPEVGCVLLERAADRLYAAGLHSEADMATYGHMFLTAAYTAAMAGNAPTARALYEEGRSIAARFETEVPHGMWNFGPGQAAQYGISVANNLGDTGAALAYGAKINPLALASTERRERFWYDLTKTHLAAGQTEQAADAIRNAVLAAPQAARRPRVRELARAAGVRSLTV